MKINIPLFMMLFSASMAISEEPLENPAVSANAQMVHAAILKLKQDGNDVALLDIAMHGELLSGQIKAIQALKGCKKRTTAKLIQDLESKNIDPRAVMGGTEGAFMNLELKTALAKTIASNVHIAPPKDNSVPIVREFIAQARKQLEQIKDDPDKDVLNRIGINGLPCSDAEQGDEGK